MEARFDRYMNHPIPHDGQACIKVDYKTGYKWVCCPFCGKRNLKIDDDTRIENLRIKCKGSNCKQDFVINITKREVK